MAFKIATKEKARLRLAIDGPSGSGKTFTSLTIAQALAGPGGKVAVLDSERGSASKYADRFRFMVDDLESHHPDVYIAGIKAAADLGADVLVIDSLSHAWMGKDGALEQVDKHAARSQSGNSFAAWREVTPMHNRLVDAILQAPMHVIVTLRSKTEYVLETNDKGKQVPRKVGLAPVQRDGLEYEFDVVGDMDLKNRMIISKTRCSTLAGAVIEKPGADLALILSDWLNGPTAEEMLAYVQTEADRCLTLEDVKALNRLLKAKGGIYYGDAAIAKLKAAHERVMAVETKPESPAEPPAAPAPTEEPLSPAPDVPEATEEQKVRKAIATVSLLLKDCKSEMDFTGVEVMRLKEGGIYLHPDVAKVVDEARRAAALPVDAPAEAAAASPGRSKPPPDGPGPARGLGSPAQPEPRIPGARFEPAG